MSVVVGSGGYVGVLSIGSEWGVMRVVLFFLKQKTAYEMRISDWSSDVCSSDLRGCLHDGGLLWVHRNELLYQCQQGLHDVLQGAIAWGQIAQVGITPGFEALQVLEAQHQAALTMQPERQWRGDRKSVGEGKSVSDRVDLGGRRLIKKKN